MTSAPTRHLSHTHTHTHSLHTHTIHNIGCSKKSMLQGFVFRRLARPSGHREICLPWRTCALRPPS